MNLGFVLQPTGPGLLCAAAAVAVGAPIFSDGLRAVRLRRHLSRLRSANLSECPAGFVHVQGKVSLESPMFAPLSGRPCAGFRLEVRSSASPSPRWVDERRSFLVTNGTREARVLEQGASWELSVSAERDIAPDQPLSDHLSALLGDIPEVTWAKSTGATLHLVERALVAGAECHVVGHARPASAMWNEAAEAETETVLLRTGTDDAAAEEISVPGGRSVTRASTPEVCIGSGEHLDFLLVTDRDPDPRRLSLPAWRMAGAAAGPALSLAGLSYLAGALDWVRALGQP
jgi:hypothetical protein